MASAIQQRLLDLSAEIATTPPEELAFSHTILCQTSLPAARPPDDVLVWERRQGRAMLLVEAGKAVNPRTKQFEQLRLPYGPKARLLLMHLNSEAVRRQSPVIPVEDTMTAFFRRLMGRTQDGRQAKMLKVQLSNLASATFRMGISQGDDRALQVNTQVIGAFDLWLRNGEGQRVIWPSNLRLSQDYFDSLQRFAVPLDERAIAALAHSAVALDIYCWMAQRLHRIPASSSQFVPWVSLQEQFGQGYTRLRAFREFFTGLLPQIHGAYPEARFDVDGHGMRLWQSPPPVRKRLVMVESVQSVAEDRANIEGGGD